MIKSTAHLRLGLSSDNPSRLAPLRYSIVLSLLLLLGVGGPLQAQDYDHYQPLKCQGPIPPELRTAASKKYAEELKELGDSAHGREGRLKDNFLLQSNFALDDMLLSGRVLFGDPVTNYITRVKDYILQDDPQLQKEIKIYLVKSPVVNAFATNSGILLVNMGLIAHLKTEAELAFVLCHEIQHYIHKHPINNYVNAEKIKSNARLLGLNNTEDYIAARTRYSRALELDADALGFDLYNKSGYALDATLGVFELLDYADQPFDQVAWDATPFEWEYLRFPAEFSKWPLDSVTLEEDEDDSMSTHPNIAKRRAALEAELAAAPQREGEAFVIGALEFLDARKRCRFEMCELFLSGHAYEDAIYNSHLLQMEEPDSRYLKKVTAEALYGLSTYKNERRMSEAHYDPDDLEGELQQMAYFFDMMDREALSILALHEIWKTHLADPNDAELKAVAQSMLAQMFTKNHTTAEWLAHVKPETLPTPIVELLYEREAVYEERKAAPPKVEEETEDNEDEGEGVFADKPKVDEEVEEEGIVDAENEKRGDSRENAYLEWALTDLFEDETFADAWANAKDAATVEKENEEFIPARVAAQNRKRARLKGQALGIDKIVLVQPIYKNVDYRDKIPVQYLASEASLERYKETLAEMCNRNNLEHAFLENRDLEEGEVEVFNDVSTMLQWFGEYLKGADDKLPLVNLRQQETNDLIARYGTKYFAWNAVVQVTSTMSQYQKMVWIMSGCTILPLLPYAIYRATKPQHETLFVTFVFDMETSEIVMEDYHGLKGKASKSATRSIIYDKVLQINHQR